MRLRARILVASAMTLVIAAAGSASAGAAEVSLGTDALPYAPPRIVVDSIGVGYTSWAAGGSGQPLDTCRLAPHAKGCEARHVFSFPGIGTSIDSGNAPVFTASGQLGVLDSRCCLVSNQKVLLLSTNHGTTFTGPTKIASDAASGMTGNLLDLHAGTFGSGSPEQLLTSSSGAVTGGGSIQATALTTAATDPGWYTPQSSFGTLSQSLGHSGSTLLAVYTTETTPHYTTSWVRYVGGDPNAAAGWSAPKPLSPAPSLDSNAQLASGPAGIFVARSIATPGDNERLVVQRFTGSGWSRPTAITSQSSGARFGITETPAGRVYVIWKQLSDESLRYAVASNRSASRFHRSVKLAARGEIEFPQIAVNAEGAGWATWTDDRTPSHVSAVAIVPRPRITRAGSFSLRTPRECVAHSASFPVSLGVSGHARPTTVRFSLTGGRAKTTTRSPYRATLALRSTARSSVTAQIRLVTAHGHTRTKSLRAPVIACP